MNDEGKLAKARKMLGRLRFGENVINNSEYNLLMNLLAKLSEKPKKEKRDYNTHVPNFSDRTWGRGE